MLLPLADIAIACQPNKGAPADAQVTPESRDM